MVVQTRGNLLYVLQITRRAQEGFKHYLEDKKMTTTESDPQADSVAYWNQNIPKEHWTKECPSFLSGIDEWSVAQIGLRDEQYPRMSWDEVQEIIRQYSVNSAGCCMYAQHVSRYESSGTIQENTIRSQALFGLPCKDQEKPWICDELYPHGTSSVA